MHLILTLAFLLESLNKNGWNHGFERRYKASEDDSILVLKFLAFWFQKSQTHKAFNA
jgi:hypothetical protein